MTDYFVHDQGLCESTHVGAGTRIWAFAHVLPKARIGSDCNICDHVFIENDVVLGNRVTVKCGVQLWDGLRVEDDVFIGPNATFTNDKMPRSKQYLDQPLITLIRNNASIGAGAVVLPGIEVGQHAMVGAGAVVTKSVPPYAVVVGNPATIVGYVNSKKSRARTHQLDMDGEARLESIVTGVFLNHFRQHTDMRGDLSAIEFEKDLPFLPKRMFQVYGVPSAKVRGEHAHYACHQFLICTHGSVSIVVDDAVNREEFLLDSPSIGLHVPAMVWAQQYKFSEDACLLVLASESYDAADYIRDYDTFARAKRAHEP